METLWFGILAFMITMYVLLDGFDLGAGVLHLLIARTAEERSVVIGTIAHVWDGNEVWLLAAGGTLYFAFPSLYASSFSGFYLPLMIVLWLLMLRAAGIELRHQLHEPVWRKFWDTVFTVSSALLAIFFGASLGNVVRGVPLNAEGYFFEPLWSFSPDPRETGIIDWFTVTMGIVALCTLTMHGACYLSMKTTGDLRRRASAAAGSLWWAVIISSAGAFLGTLAVRPATWHNYIDNPGADLIPLAALAGLAGVKAFLRRNRDVPAFLSSCLFIAGMLAATAFSLYPDLLPATGGGEYSLTVHNAIAGAYGLSVGLIWWPIGMLLAAGYFFYLFRSFRGRVTGSSDNLYH
ncbi:MAG TPA: cytochrome d ubiquinol oxidase subunit II [Bacteroidota bacterium]|nr:cytochrome d ubiquinol oxidase subunit II [Bacteroidota bacterium]